MITKLKTWIQDFLVRLAARILLADDTTRGRLGDEQYYTAMSKAYQNPAIQQYLDGREQQLITLTVEAFLTNQAENAHRTAGRLVEIRALRSRMKTCYTVKQKEIDKKSQLPRRRHSGIFVK